MKGIFLLVSVAAAGAFSLLSIIYSMGSIPFRPKEEDLGQPTPQPGVLRESDSQFLEGLVAALESERRALQERETDLEHREVTLEKQRQIVEQLKAEIEKTDAMVKAAVVAINTAEAQGGGVVFLPVGKYKCNAPLKVDKSNVILRGAGPGTTLFFTTWWGMSGKSHLQFKGSIQTGSDLYLTVESPPVIRVEGTNETLPGAPLTSAEVESLANSLMTEKQRALFEACAPTCA